MGSTDCARGGELQEGTVVNEYTPPTTFNVVLFDGEDDLISTYKVVAPDWPEAVEIAKSGEVSVHADFLLSEVLDEGGVRVWPDFPADDIFEGERT